MNQQEGGALDPDGQFLCLPNYVDLSLDDDDEKEEEEDPRQQIDYGLWELQMFYSLEEALSRRLLVDELGDPIQVNGWMLLLSETWR